LIEKCLRDEEIETFNVEFDGSEYDARQVFHRLAYTWTKWAGKNEVSVQDELFDLCEHERIFYEEILYMLAHQIAAPNSPQWFNTGLYEVYGIEGGVQEQYYFDEKQDKIVKSDSAYKRPTTSACFILPVEDDLVNKNGIYDTITKEARLFKYGAGAGSNYSKIRGKNEKLSGGGASSGLLSFLRIGDTSAAAIKSGGTTRRASKIIILDDDHPDIEEFIDWKINEEHKVASMVVGSKVIERHVDAIRAEISSCIIEATINGASSLNLNNPDLKKVIADAIEDNVPENYIYQVLHGIKNGTVTPPRYTVEWEGEAYNTVSGQTSNNSIRVTDKFIHAVKNDEEWELKARTTGEVVKKIKAKELWNKIIESAWKCADPGLQFHDIMNIWNTCPKGGEIMASNPCGEFVFLDSTSCNLASINLTSLYTNGEFNIQKYIQAITIWTTILEVTISMSQFPSQETALRSYEYRPIGLGFAGLGSLLMKMGVPYDSYSGRLVASRLSSLLTAQAYIQSAEISKDRDRPFKRFNENREEMLNVIKMHQKANADIESRLSNTYYESNYMVKNNILNIIMVLKDVNAILGIKLFL
jgi:ribonucleoside-diphosphate reductase alpha chain